MPLPAIPDGLDIPSDWIDTFILPEKGFKVLAYHPKVGIIPAFYWGKYWSLDGITHWMPLPKIPFFDHIYYKLKLKLFKFYSSVVHNAY